MLIEKIKERIEELESESDLKIQEIKKLAEKFGQSNYGIGYQRGYLFRLIEELDFLKDLIEKVK